MPTRYNHIHKLRKVDIGRKAPYIVYRCTMPTCGFYKVPELVLGMEMICWKCEQPMILTKDRMIQKPTCCTRFNTKKVDNIDVSTLLEGLTEEDE